MELYTSLIRDFENALLEKNLFFLKPETYISLSKSREIGNNYKIYREILFFKELNSFLATLKIARILKNFDEIKNIIISINDFPSHDYCSKQIIPSGIKAKLEQIFLEGRVAKLEAIIYGISDGREYRLEVKVYGSLERVF